MYKDNVLAIIKQGGYEALMAALHKKARAIALQGTVQKGRLNSQIANYHVNVVDGLEFTATLESHAAQIRNVNPKSEGYLDPFVSWNDQGQPVRKHFGRYDAPNRILGN